MAHGIDIIEDVNRSLMTWPETTSPILINVRGEGQQRPVGESDSERLFGSTVGQSNHPLIAGERFAFIVSW